MTISFIKGTKLPKNCLALYDKVTAPYNWLWYNTFFYVLGLSLCNVELCLMI